MVNWIKKYFRAREPKAIVLMYHRICDLETDPWQLAVSPDNFENQIQSLTERFKVLPLSDLNIQLANSQIIENSVYITFDDAYVDNYLNAKPILERYGCPATFFVPTHFIGRQQQFWWDELEAILLHTEKLPSKLSIEVKETLIEFDLEAEALTEEVKQKHHLWKWPEPAPTDRCQVYLKIWEQLRPLPHSTISTILNEIKAWADYHPEDSADSIPMSAQQLKELSQNNLFSLGFHTQTHPALASHLKDFQKEEIIGCRDYLQQHDYPAISAIAYPYGNYNADTISVIESNQIALGFTTKAEVITKNSSAYTLGRYQVNNYGGAELVSNLEYWLESSR